MVGIRGWQLLGVPREGRETQEEYQKNVGDPNRRVVRAL